MIQFRYVCIYIFQILFCYRLLQDTEYSSLYYTVDPYCYSVNRNLLIFPLSPSPLVTISLSLWIYFCFINKLICIVFLNSTCKWYVYPFLSHLTSRSMIICRSRHVAVNGISWLSDISACIIHLYPFVCGWTLQLLPCLGYYATVNIGSMYLFQVEFCLF